MLPGYIKCTYTILYDPETKQKLFSIQKSDTGDNPFCDLTDASGKDGYQEVTLNNECISFLKDHTSVIKSDKYKQLNKILTTDHKVLVKEEAITTEKPEKKEKSLIWLLLAGLLALL